MQDSLEGKVRTMEKINKEERMKKQNHTEEELEKVAGGKGIYGSFSSSLLKCLTPGCTWQGWRDNGELERGMVICPDCQQANFIILDVRPNGHG